MRSELTFVVILAALWWGTEPARVAGEGGTKKPDLMTVSTQNGAKIVLPKNYQVYQRNAENRASVPVTIDAPHVDGKGVARLVLQPTFTKYKPNAGLR